MRCELSTETENKISVNFRGKLYT